MNGIQDCQRSEFVQSVSRPIGIRKKCSKCGIKKSINEFHKNKSKKDGLCTECKVCHYKNQKEYQKNAKEKICEYRKKYAEKNKRHLKEYYAQWRKNNKEKIKKNNIKYKNKKSEYDKKRWKNLSIEEKLKEMKIGNMRRDKQRTINPELEIYRVAKKRAINKGLNFNLDIEDIKIPKMCPILKVKFNMFVYKQGGDFKLKDCRPSIDRIDNTKGYVKGNIAIISYRANRIKSDSTYKELKAIIKWIERNKISNGY